MLATSQAYKEAINAPTRRIVPKAVIDFTDPDLNVTSVSGDIDASLSFPDQLYDRDETFSGQMYATLEQNRWLLDGSQVIMPDDPTTREGQQGVVGDSLGDEDGVDGSTVTITMTGVDTLQIVTVAATGQLPDGIPYALTLNIYSGATLIHSQTELPNGAVYRFEGFTAIQPSKLELVVDEWNLPGRRFRLIQFLAGAMETWDGSVIYSMHVIQRADFSNLTIPYASASLEINNTDKRFDPANKESLFNSIVARQPVPLWLGVELEDTYEYVPTGVFYQQNEGWHIENDGLTIIWDLVDIIGLLVERKYEAPTPLPTTLGDWIDSIVNQLGTTFAGHYIIDGALAAAVLTCNASDVADITCGDLLRFICQASNSFPVSDPATGYLHIRELDGSTQGEITLRSQNTRAGSNNNTDIAFLTFELGGVQYNVPGTEEISDKTVNIKNPFITSTMDAVYAAQLILTQYGGNVIDSLCRGDMSRELGDVVSFELYPEEMVGARIIEQELRLENGVMTNVPLKLLQANGGELYTNVIYITESGTYTMPAGVTQITLVLVGGGQGGQGGSGGTSGIRDNTGVGGAGGKGGKVYSTPLTINDSQQIDIVIGAGGKGGKASNMYYGFLAKPVPGEMGADGEPTTATLGTVFSSANGVYMPTGYVDLLTNKAYAVSGQPGRDGQRSAKAGTNGRQMVGYGGGGGDGGMGAVVEYDESRFGQPVPPDDPNYDPNATAQIYSGWVVKEMPTSGAKGGNGGSGCVLIFYSI